LRIECLLVEERFDEEEELRMIELIEGEEAEEMGV
jgi:hypothetical protein